MSGAGILLVLIQGENVNHKIPLGVALDWFPIASAGATHDIGLD
jgi:hypothetical protein